MPARSLTVAAVDRIKPPEQGQVDHFDKGFPGFALRMSYGGAKAWVYFYRLHGKLRRLTLGQYPSMTLADAREAWRDARKAVGKGDNPARKKPVHADSFEAVADEWLKRDQAHKRSYGEVKRVIDRDVKPVWEGRQIATIGRRDALELIDGIADRGVITLARRTQSYLHRLFRWSVGRGIIEGNPMADLPKPGADVKRDRVLTDAELKLVFNAAANIGTFGPAVQLLILTGARKMEIGALCWSEIKGGTIKLEGKRTKNGEPHSIPLSPHAAALIKKLPHTGDSDFVFTTNGKRPVSGWSKAKTKFDTVCGNAVVDWTWHDFRRTMATGLQRLGVSLQVIEAILGHVSGSRAGVVGVYQRHRFDDEKRAALEAWGRHVEGIVNGKSGKVLSIKKARAR